MNNRQKYPLVSIVIPVFNREVYINKAIETSLAQTYPNIEVVIVDNHSTDNTWSVLNDWKRKDSRVRIFRNDRNIGPVRNWKRCFEESLGEFVKILWSDDWMDETFIEKAIKLFTPDVAFVMSHCDIINDEGKISHRYAFSQNLYSSLFYIDDIVFNRFQNFPVSPGCALFRLNDIKRAYMEKVPNEDGLDSSSNGAGNDLLLFLLTAKEYKEIRIVPEVLNYFRAHSGSISINTMILNYYEWARLFYIESFYNNSPKLSVLKYWFEFFFKYYPKYYKNLLRKVENVSKYNFTFLRFIVLKKGKSKRIVEERCGKIRNSVLFILCSLFIVVMRKIIENIFVRKNG